MVRMLFKNHLQITITNTDTYCNTCNIFVQMNHSSHQLNANIAHVSRQQPDYIEIFAALRCREEVREREIKYIDLGRSWESENRRNGWRKHIERQSTQSCWVRDRRKQVSERWPVTRSCRVVWHSWQLREKWWMFWREQKMEEWMNYKRLLENFEVIFGGCCCFDLSERFRVSKTRKHSSSPLNMSSCQW